MPRSTYVAVVAYLCVDLSGTDRRGLGVRAMFTVWVSVHLRGIR